MKLTFYITAIILFFNITHHAGACSSKSATYRTPTGQEYHEAQTNTSQSQSTTSLSMQASSISNNQPLQIGKLPPINYELSRKICKKLDHRFAHEARIRKNLHYNFSEKESLQFIELLHKRNKTPYINNSIDELAYFVAIQRYQVHPLRNQKCYMQHQKLQLLQHALLINLQEIKELHKSLPMSSSSHEELSMWCKKSKVLNDKKAKIIQELEMITRIKYKA
jgi:hypothetical protein